MYVQMQATRGHDARVCPHPPETHEGLAVQGCCGRVGHRFVGCCNRRGCSQAMTVEVFSGAPSVGAVGCPSSGPRWFFEGSPGRPVSGGQGHVGIVRVRGWVAGGVGRLVGVPGCSLPGEWCARQACLRGQVLRWTRRLSVRRRFAFLRGSGWWQLAHVRLSFQHSRHCHWPARVALWAVGVSRMVPAGKRAAQLRQVMGSRLTASSACWIRRSSVCRARSMGAAPRIGRAVGGVLDEMRWALVASVACVPWGDCITLTPIQSIEGPVSLAWGAGPSSCGVEL